MSDKPINLIGAVEVVIYVVKKLLIGNNDKELKKNEKQYRSKSNFDSYCDQKYEKLQNKYCYIEINAL